MSSETADVWDLHTNSDKNVRAGAQMRQYEHIADRIAAEFPGGRVLDWGCGFGQVSDLLLARGLDVTSYDYKPGAAGIEPLELFPHISVHHSSEPVALPFEDGQFAAVLSCGVLEHVPDPPGSLTELRRILRPGGTLYVYNLANRRSYLERLAKLMGMYYHGKFPDDRVYTLAEARKLLTDNGFRVLESRRANMLPLTALTGALGHRLAGIIWAANQFLARIPGLNQFATNVELVAVPAT
jgi:SAM-dependent methyltransferase